MLITQFQIKNYKAFKDSGGIVLSSGINIIVGRNNVGKTTLLEALTLTFENIRHLSPQSINSGTENSLAKVTFGITQEELLRFSPGFIDKLITDSKVWKECDIEGLNELQINLEKDAVQEKIDSGKDEEEAREKILYWLKNRSIIEIEIHIKDSKILHPEEGKNYRHGGLILDRSRRKFLAKKEPLDLLFYFLKLKNSESNIENYCLNLFKERVYRFRAERLVSGTYPIAANTTLILNSDASNLAGVLSLLQGKKPKLFKDFNEYVSYIFPEIRNVSVHQKDDSDFEILVWFSDFKEDELAFTLSSCGTGVGQVLAILYVVLTSQEASFIIIDEPQSFLHPGAAKELMEVLQLFPQHQYFISTHSPTIISAANPSSIVMLSRNNFETVPEVLDRSNLTDLRSILNEIGFKLSDVFGADRILWVEGPTEAECFPRILRKLGRKLLGGMEILPVAATGDLKKKRSAAIFDIYEKLSAGKSIIPPTIGFILDSEKRSQEEKKDLKRRVEKIGKKIEFLPYRMYENYLIYPDAIAIIVSQEDIDHSNSINASRVFEWLDKNKKDYFPQQTPPDRWLEAVDGAKLLAACFRELSENRVEFRKTKHSVQLTDWLIEHQPDSLNPLKDFLLGVLESLETAE